MPAGDVDDRQASHRESDSIILEVPVAVRAAVSHGCRHPLEAAVRNATATGKIDDACDSAHLRD
jgi:hypothetical protein